MNMFFRIDIISKVTHVHVTTKCSSTSRSSALFSDHSTSFGTNKSMHVFPNFYQHLFMDYETGVQSTVWCNGSTIGDPLTKSEEHLLHALTLTSVA